jgi:hypothetical protein
MYPPNYDTQGVMKTHHQHLKEIRQAAEMQHLAEEISQPLASEAAQPSPSPRGLQASVQGLRHWLSGWRTALTQRRLEFLNSRARRTGFNNR